MLVSGLQNEALSKMTSGSHVNYSDVHKSLHECAQEMLDKYRQKQVRTKKLGIKIRATQILLRELGKVPKDSSATSKTISAALERHVKALQGHEHLLSKKGNTYAIIEQTNGFRKMYGDARASLLRYHDLKNKLLGPGTLLSVDQEALMSTLSETLTLQTLVALDKQLRTCIKETQRIVYVYGNRRFPVQDFMNSALLYSVECCKCRNIMNQPREICPQSHLTCLKCARELTENKITRCPQCRNTLLAKFKRNIPVERLIGGLKARCFKADCRSIVQISEIKSHLGLCHEEEVECPDKCSDESTFDMKFCLILTISFFFTAYYGIYSMLFT